ncbi:hypothetical protein ABUK73_20815 [Agrobacterium sp. BA1120]|uniref:hypothetical protein n=1 Tax=Agrobacterium sp. BA1120 TaxID=3228927 RepID=UPI00336AC5B5
MVHDHDENRDFIRLVSVENIRYAAHISKWPIIRDSNSTVIPRLERVLTKGRVNGVFRTGMSVLDLYLLVAGFRYMKASNWWWTVFLRTSGPSNGFIFSMQANSCGPGRSYETGNHTSFNQEKDTLTMLTPPTNLWCELSTLTQSDRSFRKRQRDFSGMDASIADISY